MTDDPDEDSDTDDEPDPEEEERRSILDEVNDAEDYPPENMPDEGGDE